MNIIEFAHMIDMGLIVSKKYVRNKKTNWVAGVDGFFLSVKSIWLTVEGDAPHDALNELSDAISGKRIRLTLDDGQSILAMSSADSTVYQDFNVPELEPLEEV